MMRFVLPPLTALISLVLFFAPQEFLDEISHASASFVFDPEPVFVSSFDVTLPEPEVAPSADTAADLCELEALAGFHHEERKIFAAALRFFPCDMVAGLNNVMVFDDPTRPRALAGARELHLRSDFFSLPEAEEVLIHEFAHIVDLSGLRTEDHQQVSVFKDGSTPIFTDDPSYRFYRISWAHNSKWSLGTAKHDFVSGYAASDPFEDFAESYVFYVKNGNAFRAMAAEYPRLQQKYDFLKQEVFAGEEFESGPIPADLSHRIWDATKHHH